ncbi:metal-dependent hydrolase [Altererythrobacter sp. RZ02]|uniref:Metal-dependent hydrolase n=1 Tax=Pontixanthobacter rizhaonensis TaxID=2730337 RepID=A0A848QD84_9SPHN|nr:metal-dependent hydrolase [Pontixanthobacter rizhaonensis]NMW31581.1 metal-dependent hydrolase [Pontixanthobacter rizhaonensis]
MDNLTHSLVGALLGQAGLKRKTGLAMPALIIGANLPDVDAACFFWLDGAEHLGFRRGITHGPPALILLPLILAALLYGFDRWQAKRGKRPEGRLPVSFKWLYLLSFIGCLTHPALDFLNVYGIRLLEPFSSQWSYGNTLFIIDIWLWIGMGFTTWFSLWREKNDKTWRWPAIAALVLTVLYIGANFVTSVGTQVAYSINDKALSGGADSPAVKPDIPDGVFIPSPPPFLSFQREIIVGDRNDYWIVPAGELPSPWKAKRVSENRCAWPDFAEMRKTNSDLDAFLFWSRTPFVEDDGKGGILLRDARFYDPRARDRFTVALPDVPCKPITAEPHAH